MLNGGKTMLISVGKKGQVRRRRRPLRRPEAEVPLSAADPEQPLRRPRRTDAVADRRRVPEHAQGGRRRRELPPPRLRQWAPGAEFVGAESCKTCHPETFAKWATTKHANAYQALLEVPNGEPPVTTPNASVATRRASSTTPAGGRPSRPRTSRATSARIATGPPRSTSPSPTTWTSARPSPAPPRTPTQPALPPVPRRGQLAQVRLRDLLGQDRPQGPGYVQRPQGPPGVPRRWPTAIPGSGGRNSSRSHHRPPLG